MYTLPGNTDWSLRRAHLRQLLRQLDADEAWALCQILAGRYDRQFGGSVLRQPLSSRWGSAIDILRRRLRRETGNPARLRGQPRGPRRSTEGPASDVVPTDTTDQPDA